MRSPERKTPEPKLPSNQNEESTSQKTQIQVNVLEMPPESYESFLVQPKTPILALPTPESVQNETETKEERFNSFQIVPVQDSLRSSIQSPLPQKIKSKADANRNSANEKSTRKQTLCPNFDKQENVVEANKIEETFTSFQVCPQHQTPPPFCPSDEAKEGNSTKIAFNSFTVYPNQETFEEEINSNIGSLPTDRNRINISSLSTEVSKYYK